MLLDDLFRSDDLVNFWLGHPSVANGAVGLLGLSVSEWVTVI